MSHRIFISYSHENYAEALRCHRAVGMLCAGLDGVSEIFLDCEGDAQLVAGDDWRQRISQALEQADIFVVLLSSEFFASDFCRGVELKRMFERYADDPSVLIIGVALHALEPERFVAKGLDRAWSMGRFQCLPQGEVRTWLGHKLGLRPLSDWPANRQNDAWNTVIEQIERALARAVAPPDASSEPLTLLREPLPLARRASVRARWRWPAVAAGLVLISAAALGLWLQGVASGMRDDLRIDRADLALERLAKIPGWLDGWPGLGTARAAAQLNAAGLDERADDTHLARELKAQLAAHPQDADLLYLQARTAFQNANAETLPQAVEAAQAALRSDPRHAAAQTLLALAADRVGDLAGAAPHYAKAAELAPDVPQYVSNHARSLLDRGQPAQAVQAYQQVDSSFILAPVEQALAYWAQGKLVEAEQAQARALALLGDATVAARPANQRAWVFSFLDPRQPGAMLELTVAAEHRRCLVAYERHATRALRAAAAGETAVPTLSAPPDCAGIEQIDSLHDLIDADLCRYVVHRQPALRDAAMALRAALGRSAACAALLAPAPPAASSPLTWRDDDGYPEGRSPA